MTRNALVAFLLLFGVLTGCGPSKSNSTLPTQAIPDSENATLVYWASLDRAHKQINSIDQLFAELQTPSQIVPAMKDASVSYRNVSRQINGLPVRDVDSDVVKYAAQMAECSTNASLLLSDLADFINDVTQHIDDTKSFGKGLESFMRGFFGDPLGPFNDNNTKLKQFDARRRVLLDRYTALHEKNSKIESLELITRADLTKRYGLEVPTFTGQTNPTTQPYQIVIGALTVKPKKSDGRDWDALGGLPDPYIKLTNRNRGVQFVTDIKKDTLTAIYNFKGPLASEGDILDIEVWDKDVQFDDEIGKTTHTVTSAELNSGKVVLSFGQAASLELRFTK